jgi:gamma-glutamyltranspeptidase/glutathione hydrolase
MDNRDTMEEGLVMRDVVASVVAALVLLLPPSSLLAQPTKIVAGVGAANPLAVEAGIEILKAGGSAVDAAVAIQAMLGLVEPQSSGVAGGGFLMYYDAATGRITMLDGREVAPAAATTTMFLGDDGKPLSFTEAVISGRATGVPGVMPMLGVAHARFGRLPWNRLFRGAIVAADSGFVVPPRLGRFVNGESVQAAQPDVKRLFSRPGGTPVRPGELMRNRAYASTLRQLASRGPRALHKGALARAIVARTRMPPLPGSMTLSDLSRYKPVERTPLCRPYREYVVCVPPPPSNGASLLQLLAMLEHTDIAARGPDDPQAWFLFAQASRIMYADRDRYIADPAYASVPVEGLLDAAYIASRAALIGDRAGPAPAAGQPRGSASAADATREAPGTSHFVVVDPKGNVVSMTTTVESLFGTGRAVGGFMLNNEMTDFSFVPSVDGRPVANAVAGRKRPRSSMSPVIILDREGRFQAALGSPGGSAILAYVAKMLVGLLAWHLPVQQAIDLPNIYARGDNVSGEASKLSSPVIDGLAARGIVVKPGEGEDSGLHGVIVRGPGNLEGGADPRRDGTWQTLGERDVQLRRSRD